MTTPTRTSLLEQIRTEIKSADVGAEVVSRRAATEVNRRADLIANGLAKYDTMEKELKALKPDIPAVLRSDGEVLVDDGFTKKTIEARKKLTARLEKLEKAINKALEARDYGDLQNLVK
jgi:chaperonin cofactor prefoldin